MQDEQMLSLLRAAQDVVNDAERIKAWRTLDNALVERQHGPYAVVVDAEVFAALREAVQAIHDSAVATIERALAEQRRESIGARQESAGMPLDAGRMSADGDPEGAGDPNESHRP